MTARIVVTLGLLVSALSIPRPVFASDESTAEVVEDAAVVEAQPPWTGPQTGVRARLQCAIAYESRGNPNAYNARSHASGLLQFLPSTWATTPQGRAGLSVFDGYANWEAGVWLASSYPGAFDHHWAADVRLGC